MSRAGPILAGLSAALFAGMVWITHGVLKPHANGLEPFDARIAGYSFQDARAYLEALDAVGRAEYLFEMRLLDTVFPVVFAMFLGLCVLRVSGRFHPWSRVILTLPAAGYAMMDLAENAVVAQMLRMSPSDLNADLVALASGFTVSKWVLVAVAIVVPCVLWLTGRGRAG